MTKRSVKDLTPPFPFNPEVRHHLPSAERSRTTHQRVSDVQGEGDAAADVRQGRQVQQQRQRLHAVPLQDWPGRLETERRQTVRGAIPERGLTPLSTTEEQNMAVMGTTPRSDNFEKLNILFNNVNNIFFP